MECKNCGNIFEGKYCNNCGQKFFSPNDKSIRKIIGDAFHFITHFEGSFFNTVKTVLLRPSKLTLDYSNGIQKRYFKPISLFLFIVILYLLFPMFHALNLKMESYRTLPITGKIVSEQIDSKINNGAISEENLSLKFEKKSKTISKLLLLLFIPLSGLLIKLLYLKKSNWYDIFVLSTELNIYYLLVFFLLFPIFYLLFTLILGEELLGNDSLGILVTLLFGIYNSILFRNFFRSSRLISVLKGISFGIVHTLVILFLYRFLVFEITFLLV